MNEKPTPETESKPAAAKWEPANPKKARRTPKTRAPQNRDPEITAVYARAKAEADKVRATKRSAAILNTLLTKRIGQLTDDHRQRLYEALAKICTPTLPGV